MMCTIIHLGNQAPPSQVVTYVDDMNESFAEIDIWKVTPIFTAALEDKMQRAETLGLPLLQINQE
jgi:hypothetical protein